MDSVDSLSPFTIAECKIQRDNQASTRYPTRIGKMSGYHKPRHSSSIRNQCLYVCLIVLSIAVFALSVFILVDKCLEDEKLNDLAKVVARNQQMLLAMNARCNGTQRLIQEKANEMIEVVKQTGEALMKNITLANMVLHGDGSSIDIGYAPAASMR